MRKIRQWNQLPKQLDITVDPKNRINSGQQQGYHGMEIKKGLSKNGFEICGNA